MPVDGCRMPRTARATASPSQEAIAERSPARAAASDSGAAFPPDSFGRCLREGDHQLDSVRVVSAPGPRQGLPRLEPQCVRHRGGEQRVAPTLPPFEKPVARHGDELGPRRDHRRQRRNRRRVTNDVREHVFAAPVKVVKGRQRRTQSLYRVALTGPRRGVWRRDFAGEVRGTRREKRGLVRKMPVDRETFDAGPEGDRADRRFRWADLTVQRNDGLDDPPTRVGLLLARSFSSYRRDIQ